MNQTPLFDVVHVEGPDALAFLHSQFAADLNAVAEGALRWSALLNPQGRVLHVVGVWRLAENTFALLVPFLRGAELVEDLRKFVLRRKLILRHDSTAGVAVSAEGAATGIRGLTLGLQGAGGDHIVGRDALDAFVHEGLALIDAPAAGRHLAHSLRLDRFAAFSVKKGCYPGQEIVARTHFLGRNKRVLVRLTHSAAATFVAGDSVSDGAQDLGEIVCAGVHSALAVLTQPVPESGTLTMSASRSSVTLANCFLDPP